MNGSGAVSPEGQSATLRVCAPAKINLFLHVGEKRGDGFHELESLVVFAEECDRLTFAPAEELRLDSGGPFAPALGPVKANLVLRAAEALAEGRGAAIALEKNLPVSAGLGGGSADAAAALRGLNALWGLGRSERELAAVGATLGSDVAACVYSRTLWMTGRGERISERRQLPPFEMVLVNPGVVLSTASVFAALNGRTGLGAIEPPAGEIVTEWDLVEYLGAAGNDMEAPAAELAPVVEEVLAALAHEPGCILAQMSGSGASALGLFQHGQWAKGAAQRIAEDHPGWWVRATRIATPEFAAPIAL